MYKTDGDPTPEELKFPYKELIRVLSQRTIAANLVLQNLQEKSTVGLTYCNSDDRVRG